MMQDEETTLQELVQLTEKFVALADQLLASDKITQKEYATLTQTKKDFLEQTLKENTYSY